MRLHKTCLTLMLATALSLTVIEPAHAYIDMGTGSLIFQMLVAGLVGAGFTIKMYWHALKERVNRMLGRSATAPNAHVPGSESISHTSGDNHTTGSGDGGGSSDD
jgi:hypothetical protein